MERQKEQQIRSRIPKQEAEEELKTEAEEKELERKMGELEEDMKTMEEVKKKAREEDWSGEHAKIKELVFQKLTAAYSINARRE